MSNTETFNRCSNGHIVPENATFCPWCGEVVNKNGNQNAGRADYNSYNNRTNRNYETITMSPAGHGDSRHTVLLDGDPGHADRTIFVNPADRNQVSSTGRLVGFLVTYGISNTGSYFPVRAGREIIGRGESATIKINDKQLSKEHAVILYRRGMFIFEDKLSTNGSIVNGSEVIDKVQLRHGDIIEVGSYHYIFVEIPTNDNIECINN